MNTNQLADISKFTGGMASDGKRHVIRMNSHAVVTNLNQPKPALFDIDSNMSSVGIDSIFNQFFDHRSRARHYLASGDLVDKQWG